MVAIRDGKYSHVSLAETAKPYFGDVERMTYLQWLQRYVELAIGAGDSSAAARAAATCRSRPVTTQVRSGSTWPDFSDLKISEKEVADLRKQTAH